MNSIATTSTVRMNEPARLMTDPSKVQTRYSQLRQTAGWGEGIPQLGPEITGVETHLGGGSIYNSQFAARQFLWMMATIDHPLATRLCAGTAPSQIIDQLIKGQTFKEISILDVACGCRPTFARSMRTFGAQVVTVDKIDANSLIRNSNLPCVGATNEHILHIEGDITVPQTRQAAIAKMPGGFSVITHAHLMSVSGSMPAPIEFLKDGGFYIPVEVTSAGLFPAIKQGDKLTPL